MHTPVIKLLQYPVGHSSGAPTAVFANSTASAIKLSSKAEFPAAVSVSFLRLFGASTSEPWIYESNQDKEIDSEVLRC